MEYQKNFTANPVAESSMYDEEGRRAKAEKIVAIVKDYYGDIKPLSVLDVSCSTGIISRYLSSHFRIVTGIDIDEAAVAFAKENSIATNLKFHVMDALNTSFANNEFDIVVCNQMYEHVPDAKALLDEIRRVLVPGGVCYFGATNRLKVIETHYGRLPFLSYFSKPFANLYLRLLGRGRYYYENLYSYWALKRLCKDFDLIDYTIKVVMHPDRFGVTDMLEPGSLRQRLAVVLLKYAYWFSPGYIWILKKSEIESDATAVRH